MKSFFKLIGIIALAAMVGLSVTSCDWLLGGNGDDPCDEHTSEATITITGLGDYNGDIAVVYLGTGSSIKFFDLGLIGSGSVVLDDFWCWECDESGFQPGTYWVRLNIFDFDDDSIDYYFGVITSKSISAGSSFIDFSDFTETDENWVVIGTQPIPGSLTITGLEAFDGWYILGNADPLFAANNVIVYPMMGQFAYYGVQIENGSVTLPVWEIDGPYQDEHSDYYIDKLGYDGNDQTTFYLTLWEGQEGSLYSHMYYSISGTVTVTFADGIATGVFVGEGEFGLTISGLGDYMGYNIVAYVDGNDSIAAGDKIGGEGGFGQGVPIIGFYIYDSTIVLPVWDIDITGEPSAYDLESEVYTGNDTVTLIIFIWEDSSFNPMFYTGTAHHYTALGRMEA